MLNLTEKLDVFTAIKKHKSKSLWCILGFHYASSCTIVPQSPGYNCHLILNSYKEPRDRRCAEVRARKDFFQHPLQPESPTNNQDSARIVPNLFWWKCSGDLLDWLKMWHWLTLKGATSTLLLPKRQWLQCEASRMGHCSSKYVEGIQG